LFFFLSKKNKNLFLFVQQPFVCIRLNFQISRVPTFLYHARRLQLLMNINRSYFFLIAYFLLLYFEVYSMPKLYFRHGAVSSAKTLNLLAVAHNYRTQGKSVVLMKVTIVFFFYSLILSLVNHLFFFCLLYIVLHCIAFLCFALLLLRFCLTAGYGCAIWRKQRNLPCWTYSER
jgi:hypothetical protein